MEDLDVIAAFDMVRLLVRQRKAFAGGQARSADSEADLGVRQVAEGYAREADMRQITQVVKVRQGMIEEAGKHQVGMKAHCTAVQVEMVADTGRQEDQRTEVD